MKMTEQSIKEMIYLFLKMFPELISRNCRKKFNKYQHVPRRFLELCVWPIPNNYPLSLTDLFKYQFEGKLIISNEKINERIEKRRLEAKRIIEDERIKKEKIEKRRIEEKRRKGIRNLNPKKINRYDIRYHAKNGNEEALSKVLKEFILSRLHEEEKEIAEKSMKEEGNRYQVPGIIIRSLINDRLLSLSDFAMFDLSHIVRCLCDRQRKNNYVPSRPSMKVKKQSFKRKDCCQETCQEWNYGTCSSNPVRPQYNNNGTITDCDRYRKKEYKISRVQDYFVTGGD